VWRCEAGVRQVDGITLKDGRCLTGGEHNLPPALQHLCALALVDDQRDRIDF
jgi:hypothetical protein